MVKEKLVLRKEIKVIMKKAMYTIIIFLLGMILVRKNPNIKSKINKTVYQESPNYMKAQKLYKKYFGSVFPNEEKEKSVFTEKLTYTKAKKDNNGVKLEVSNNYLVPAIDSGIIIFLENNKLIISQVNGINVEYGNVNVSNHKLYDYIEKDTLIGETISNTLYLSFEKDGEYLDYKDYI